MTMDCSLKERISATDLCTLLMNLVKELFDHPALRPGRGLENIHLYIWLLKDLSWAQDWYYSGMIFGCLAVLWAFLLIVTAVRNSAVNEIFVSVAIFLW